MPVDVDCFQSGEDTWRTECACAIFDVSIVLTSHTDTFTYGHTITITNRHEMMENMTLIKNTRYTTKHYHQNTHAHRHCYSHRRQREPASIHTNYAVCRE